MTLEESPHYAINESTLSKMGFKKFGDGWNISSNLASETTPRATTVRPTHASSSSSAMLDNFKDLKLYIGEQISGLKAHYDTRMDRHGTRVERIEYDVSSLHQHFFPTQHISPIHRSPVHFSPVAHTSQPSRTGDFLAASEDGETLGSRDTIDPSNLLLATGRTILHPGDFENDEDSYESPTVDDDGDSDGAQLVFGSSFVYC